MTARKYNTTSEAEIRALVDQGLSFVEIASRLGICLSQLRAGASLLGIRRKRVNGVGSVGVGNKWSRELLLDFVERMTRGESLHVFAAEHGVSRQAVYIFLQRAGLPTSVIAAVRAKHAAIAQSAERPLCMGEVAGSIPAGGSI